MFFFQCTTQLMKIAERFIIRNIYCEVLLYLIYYRYSCFFLFKVVIKSIITNFAPLYLIVERWTKNIFLRLIYVKVIANMTEFLKGYCESQI